MKIFEIRILLTILIFLLMIISGVGLSRKGKPYNVILFNIHKMISLGAIGMMLITVLYYSKDSIIGKNEVMSIIITGILFLTLLISGGLLNIKKEMPKILLVLHRALPIVLLVSAFFAVFLLLD